MAAIPPSTHARGLTPALTIGPSAQATPLEQLSLDVFVETLLPYICDSPREYAALIGTCRQWYHNCHTPAAVQMLIASIFRHAPFHLGPRQDTCSTVCRLDHNIRSGVYASAVLPQSMSALLMQPLEMQGHINVSHFRMQPLQDGRRILCPLDAGGGRCVVNIEDASQVTLQRGSAAEGDLVCASALFPDGQRVILGTQRGVLNVCDMVEGTCIATTQGYVGQVRAIAMIPGGQKQQMVVACVVEESEEQSKTMVYTVYTVTERGCIPSTQWHDDAYAPDYAHDGAMVVLKCRRLLVHVQTGLKIFNLENRECTAFLPMDITGNPGIVAAPGGQEHIVCYVNPSLNVYDPVNGVLIATLSTDAAGATGSISVLPGGRQFVISKLSYQEARLQLKGEIWNLVDGIWTAAPLQRIGVFLSHRNICELSYLSEPPNVLYNDNLAAELTRWDSRSGACIAQDVKAPLERQVASAVLPGGRYVVMAARPLLVGGHPSPDSDVVCRVWDHGADYDTVFEELAELLRIGSPEAVKSAMFRFKQMPSRAKDAIYGKLYDILKPFPWGQDYFGCAEDAFLCRNGQSSTPEQRAAAIEAYLGTPVK